MGVTTYSALAWRSARAEWDAGGFGPKWDPYRALAAKRGYIFPPAGEPTDDPEDEHPSQRALLSQAIDDTPRLLARCIGRSRSWHEVVSLLIETRDEVRRRYGAEPLPDPRAIGPAEAASILRGLGR